MGFEQCVDEIIELWASMGIDPKSLTRDDASELLKQFNEITKNKPIEYRLASLEKLLDDASNRKLLRHQVYSLLGKLRELDNKAKTKEVEILATSLILDHDVRPQDARMNILDSSNTPLRETVGVSVEGRRYQAMGTLIAALREKKVLHVIGDADNTRDVIRAFSELENTGRVSEGTSAEIATTAQVLLNHGRTWMKLLRARGTYFSDAFSFMFGLRGLPSDLSLKFTRDEFVNKVLKDVHIDYEKFTEMDTGMEIGEYIGKIYDRIEAKDYAQAPIGKFDGLRGAITGRATNLASKAEFHLDLPLTPEGHVAFRDIFLDKEALSFSLRRKMDLYGRALGIMERLGPNPEGVLNHLDEFLARVHGVEHNKFTDLRFEKGVLRYGGLDNVSSKDILRQLDGSANIPENVSMARIASTVRSYEAMAKLPAGLLAQITDIPIDMAIMHTSTGQHAGTTLINRITNLFDLFPSEDKKVLADYLLTSLDHYGKNIIYENTGGTVRPGLTSRLIEFGYSLNLMGHWDIKGKFADSQSLSAFSANAILGGRDDLRILDTMKNYGIEKSDHSALKDAVVNVEGRNYIIPERIADTTLQRKFQSMLVDIKNIATPTPGAGERALLQGSGKRGILKDEIWMSAMMFKSFPMVMTRRVLPRIAADAGFTGLVATGVGMVFWALVGDVIRQSAFGRTIPDYSRVENWSTLLARSGFGGFYADILFGKYNDYGKDPINYFAGPTLGLGADALQAYSTLTFDWMRDIEKEGLVPPDTRAFERLVSSNTPVINLWYLRWAFGNTFLHAIMEMADPGSVSRAEQHLESRTGQTFTPSLLEIMQGK